MYYENDVSVHLEWNMSFREQS